MLSVTLTVIVRAAGFVAYTFVVTVTSPGVAAFLVQVMVTDTGMLVGASGAQTSPNETLASDGCLVRSHVTLAFATADMSFSSVCGRTSFTGSGTSFLPLGFIRFEC